jgi:hypothetical protein
MLKIVKAMSRDMVRTLKKIEYTEYKGYGERERK